MNFWRQWDFTPWWHYTSVCQTQYYPLFTPGHGVAATARQQIMAYNEKCLWRQWDSSQWWRYTNAYTPDTWSSQFSLFPENSGWPLPKSGHVPAATAGQELSSLPQSNPESLEFDRVFVDFNYLVNSMGIYFLKEFAVVGRKTDGTHFQQCYIVKSTERYQEYTARCDNLLARHGIDWTDGDVSFNTVRRLLDTIQDSSGIYLQSNKKARILQTVFRRPLQTVKCYDGVGEVPEPQPPFCAFHATKTDRECALKSASLMDMRYKTPRYAWPQD